MALTTTLSVITFSNSDNMEGIILSVTGSLIAILLAVIAFFLQRFVRQNDQMVSDINSIKIIITASQSELEGLKVSNHDGHCTITNRLDDHEARIRQHDKDINHLKIIKHG